ncbi:MAG: FAD-dependent oxidoreductase [Candidatus Falkowbacteria bacterium]
MIYDTIIIGAGPAGFTAAIFTTRREMKTLIISREIGGQIVWAGEIENYPGFKSVKNYEFIESFKDQALSFGAELKESEVQKIEKNSDNTFKVFTNKEEFLTRSIILTIGLSPRRLAVPGEIEFSGKGVSYCANCDGPLYRGKQVAVIGGGNAAFDAAEVLSKIASKVYLLHRGKDFKAFDGLVSEVSSRDNIEIVKDIKIKEIFGNKSVEKLIYETSDNGNKEILVDGIFIEIGRIASTDLVADFVDRDEKMQLMVNGNMETKTAGIFAAGDVTNASEFKQITVATGQATIAALMAYKFLQGKTGSIGLSK